MTKPSRLLISLLMWLGAAMAGGVVVASGVYLYLSPKLPPVESLRDTQLQIPLRVYTSDQVLIGEFGEKKRSPVTYDEVPAEFIQAILAAEDDKFLEHHGVDLTGLLRAATELASTGSIQSGGSTITMQVAKNYFLSRERTFTRKFTEILLALHIERALSKDEILELYVNKIYLGNRAYGIGAASQIYYGKPIDELDLAQLAMIAGLPQAPSANNPLANPERALGRRNWILSRMRGLGSITQEQYLEATAQPLTARLHSAVLELPSPWVAEMARAELFERFGAAAYTEGFRVITTVDSKLQARANQAVQDGLEAYDERHGYRKIETRLTPAADQSNNPQPPIDAWQSQLAAMPRIGGREPAGVIAVAAKNISVLRANGETLILDWDAGLSKIKPYLSVDSFDKSPTRADKFFKPGNIVQIRQDEGRWILSQIPDAQAALISLNPEDGAILAMVGGIDFYQSKFNRVLQARRQPGSAFKPFMYAAALENGLTPATIINDAPVVFDDDRLEDTWRPVNASGRFYGPTRLRKALYLSRNLVSIRLLREVGIDKTINYVTRFGFAKDDMPRNLSLALGTLSISPMELAGAYAILANGGFKVEPYLITEIQNVDGEPIYFAPISIACADCERDNSAAQGNPVTATAEPDESSTPQMSDPGQLIRAEPSYAPRIMDQRVNYQINSILRDVVRRGTATRANVLKRSDLAGKTGTTNGPTDAWFAGFNRDAVTVTWLGFDQNTNLGRREYGGSAALPIWIDYMRLALEGKSERHWPQPDGLTMVRIDPITGLLARPGQSDAIFETFRTELVPEEYSDGGGIRGNTSSGGGKVLIEDDLF